MHAQETEFPSSLVYIPQRETRIEYSGTTFNIIHAYGQQSKCFAQIAVQRERQRLQIVVTAGLEGQKEAAGVLTGLDLKVEGNESEDEALG